MLAVLHAMVQKAKVELDLHSRVKKVTISQQLSKELAVNYYWLNRGGFSRTGMPARATNSLALVNASALYAAS